MKVAPTPAEQAQVLRVHSVVFAATMVLIVAVNALTSLAAGTAGHWSAWWSIWALLGWGMGLATHAFVVWLQPTDDDPGGEGIAPS